MSIGNVSDYSSFLQNYYVPTISGSGMETMQYTEPGSVSQSLPADDIHEEASTISPARKDASLEEISVSLNKWEGFDYIGKDSDIQALDVQKAISDMRKDQVLQQYQYFVGSARNLMTQSAEGTVITK